MQALDCCAQQVADMFCRSRWTLFLQHRQVRCAKDVATHCSTQWLAHLLCSRGLEPSLLMLPELAGVCRLCRAGQLSAAQVLRRLRHHWLNQPAQGVSSWRDVHAQGERGLCWLSDV